MKTSEFIARINGKQFSVYVSGEFERKTDFWGFMKLISGYSDFPQYTRKEKEETMEQAIVDRTFYIDANIDVKISK